MKTTIDLDEEKLERVMKLTGLDTRKATIDAALSELERKAKIAHFYARIRSVEIPADAVDPNYDLMKLREMEKPKAGDTY